MSLMLALNTTMAGLDKTETQISVVSSNVSNADKPGYTVKKYQSDYITANGLTVPISGEIIGALDMDLYESVIETNTGYGYFSTIEEFFKEYSDSLGTTNGDNTLSSYMDNLEAAIGALETTPSDSSRKVNVISAAEAMAREITSLSATVQGLRLEADKEIETSVVNINQLLNELDKLNEQVSYLSVNGTTTADVEDERMRTLEELSEYLDITYFINDSDQLKIYTATGQTLLDSYPHELSHNAVTSASSANTYPGGFDDITVNGVDITTNIKDGKIAALLELRDAILVNEQDKLDEFSSVLTQTVNSAFNDGTAYPPRTSLTSDLDGLNVADPFAGTGIVRIATVDSNGIVQSFADIDLTTTATIGAVVTAIDGIAGISASLNASGELVMTADNAGEGIAMNQMTSSVGAGTDSFGMYFGFSNIFTNTGAEYIAVSNYLKTSSEALASSVLDNDAALAVGDTGLVGGNGSTVTAVYAALTSNVAFSAAGGFSAQGVTLSNYANKIISYVATTADNAATEAETAENLYYGLKTTMENATGVNIDEETAKMISLESQYEASAVVLSTLQELFETLVNAVR